MFTPNPATTASGHAVSIAASVYVAGPPGVPTMIPLEHVTVRVDQNRPLATSQDCHAPATITPCAVFWYGSNTSVEKPAVPPFKKVTSWYDGSATVPGGVTCLV